MGCRHLYGGEGSREFAGWMPRSKSAGSGSCARFIFRFLRNFQIDLQMVAFMCTPSAVNRGSSLDSFSSTCRDFDKRYSDQGEGGILKVSTHIFLMARHIKHFLKLLPYICVSSYETSFPFISPLLSWQFYFLDIKFLHFFLKFCLSALVWCIARRFFSHFLAVCPLICFPVLGRNFIYE